ncbi:hypothetical protein [Stieleria neptunia]|uniref:hypothetical protein n=1 Tax=Stieleria neptunia TaxID=2527979 RepID=UPI0011A2AED0|nr:hypothetical protein [Stieleria neptunia]
MEEASVFVLRCIAKKGLFVIVEKSKPDWDGDSGREPLAVSQPTKVDSARDRTADLQDFVSHLRRDAVDDPIHYLIRSNTSCDGE